MTFIKRLKTQIATLLCFAVIFSLSVPLAANSESSAQNQVADAASAYDFLKSVGAMDPEEVPFDGNMQITRAHFVKLALHLSGDAPHVLVSDDEVFYDVTPSTAYENYIETAYRTGYISGTSSGVFAPEQPITLVQALKILCNVLGYQRFAESYGGYPAGYLVMAQRTDLLDGLTISSDSPLNMANAMILLENAVLTEIMQIVSIGDTVDMKSFDGETLLYKKHGVDYIEGVVNADSYTNLLANKSTLDKNQLSIEDVVFNAGSVETADFLGCNVRLYFDSEAASSVKTALWAELTLDNKSLTCTADELEIDGDKISCYTDENSTKKLKLSPTLSYILNGKMSFMSPEELLGVEKGDITFISNDGDSTIDVIKVTSYDTFMVSGVSSSSGIIVTNDGTRILLDPDSDEYSFDLSKNGAPAELSAIYKDDVILVSEGTGEGYRHISIKASGKSLNASFDEIGDGYAVVSGIKYKLDTAVGDKVKTGTVYRIALDIFDNICYISAHKDIVYGFLYGLDKQGMHRPQCRIFTENNRWVDLYFADKVRYNGVSYSADELYTELTKNGDDYKKLVRYNVNSVPELINLESYTEIPIGDENERNAEENDTFRLSYSGSLRYRNSPKSFNGVFFVDANARIFNIPSDLSQDNFKVRDISALKTDTAYTVSAFNVDRYLTSSVLTTPDLTSDSEISNTDKFMVVKSVGQMVNANGEGVPSVRGYWDGEEIAFPVNLGDEGVDSSVLNSLKKGDIILFKYDDDSNIIAITRYPTENTYYTSSATLYTTCNIIGGKVSEVDITGKKIRMTYSDDGSEIGVIYNDSSSACIWEKSSGTYRAADMSELMPGDIMFANTRYLMCYDVVIIR